MTEQEKVEQVIRDRAAFLSEHEQPAYNQRAALEYVGTTLTLLADIMRGLERRIRTLEEKE